MTAADHVRALLRHAPGLPVHDVILTAKPIPSHLLETYAACGARPVVADLPSLRALGCRPVPRQILAAENKIRHDPDRLAAAVLRVAAEHGGRRRFEEPAGQVLA